MASGVGNTTGNTGAGSTGSGAATDRKTIAGNFDAFLLLLTTQLQNQNPLEPLDTNQFTQQLVQFASVEQQIKSNETLNSLLTSSRSSIVSSASSFVGMQVTADGATSRLTGGRAEWRLNLSRAATATITITDSKGNVVKTATKSLGAGDQDYSWDGLTSTGLPAPEGDYTITVTGRDVTGQSVTVKTEVSGRVDSVDMAGDEPVLVLGGVRVPLTNVKTIGRASDG
jgi:flagellar basal-body rod modification protein FlgD